MNYNPDIVTAYFREMEIPKPIYEHRFHPVRKWRFDLAWPEQRVALEVQGGLFVGGRHNRGAALIKEYEKLSTAASMGWRMLYCQPCDLLMNENIELIKRALNYNGEENE